MYIQETLGLWYSTDKTGLASYVFKTFNTNDGRDRFTRSTAGKSNAFLQRISCYFLSTTLFLHWFMPFRLGPVLRSCPVEVSVPSDRTCFSHSVYLFSVVFWMYRVNASIRLQPRPLVTAALTSLRGPSERWPATRGIFFFFFSLGSLPPLHL